MLPPRFARHFPHGDKVTPDDFARVQETLERVLLPLTQQDDVITPVLLNGWLHLNVDDLAPPGYWKDAFGLVHLRGVVYGGIVVAPTPIFTLPEGYRPQYREVFPSLTGAGSPPTLARFDVYPNGNVSVISATVGSWLTLSGATFRAGD